MITRDARDGSRGVDILLFDEDGTQQEQTRTVGMSGAGDQGFPTLAEREVGRIVLSYTDSSDGGSNPLQLAFFEVIGPKIRIFGTEGDDSLGGLGERPDSWPGR